MSYRPTTSTRSSHLYSTARQRQQGLHINIVPPDNVGLLPCTLFEQNNGTSPTCNSNRTGKAPLLVAPPGNVLNENNLFLHLDVKVL